MSVKESICKATVFIPPVVSLESSTWRAVAEVETCPLSSVCDIAPSTETIAPTTGSPLSNTVTSSFDNNVNSVDLAKDEIAELEYLEVYLPEQMGEEEVRKIVKEVVAQVGASSPADMGKCMGPLMGRLNGKADGKLISRLVKEKLS